MVFAFAAGPRGQSAVDVCLNWNLDRHPADVDKHGRREGGGEFSVGVRGVPRVRLFLLHLLHVPEQAGHVHGAGAGQEPFLRALLCGGQSGRGDFPHPLGSHD